MIRIIRNYIINNTNFRYLIDYKCEAIDLYSFKVSCNASNWTAFEPDKLELMALRKGLHESCWLGNKKKYFHLNKFNENSWDGSY